MTTTYESPKTTFNNHNPINDFDANSEGQLIQKYRVLYKGSRFIPDQKTQIINSDQFQSSVYYRQGEDSELIKNPSFDQVYQLLLWLSTDRSINDL